MKLYTEEQVIDIFEKYGNMSAINARNILDLSESIELPSDSQLRKIAKQICNGHQHAIRYNQMLICCFNMGKSVIEKIQGGNK